MSEHVALEIRDHRVNGVVECLTKWNF